MSFRCEIEFDDNVSGIFYSGVQDLSGKIKFEVFTSTLVKKIILTIRGNGKCQLVTQYHEYRGAQVGYKYGNGTEEYLNVENELVSDDQMFYPGEYSLPFNCTLPLVLPSSIKGKNGSIQYKVLARFICAHRVDLTFQKPFTVVSYLDLNKIPEVKAPHQQKVSTKISSLFCGSKTIEVTVTLPRLGFAANESFQIQVDIKNPTSVKTLPIKIVLKKCVIYKINYHLAKFFRRTRSQSFTIQRCIAGEPFSRANKTIQANFRIPSTVPTLSNVQSKLINISYTLHCKLKIAGLHVNPELKFDIIIGSVPIKAKGSPSPSTSSS